MNFSIDKTKKIAFIGPVPPPLGGVAVVNQSFQDINYEGFEVLSFNTSGNKVREQLYEGFNLGSVIRNLTLGKALKHFLKANKPDVVNLFVTSGFSVLRDIYFLKIIYKANIPVIIHFHSKTKGEFALRRNRLKIVASYFNKYANKIVLLSEYHYNFFTEFFDKKKCLIIENFVDYSVFHNTVDNKKQEFLFVGRLSEQKGFFDLLEAAHMIKLKGMDFKINVIGLAPTEEDESKINTLITRYALAKNLILHGATFGKDKYKLFKQCKFLVFPSHFENSPVVLKEAIASKMAIIASDIIANKNILKTFKNHVLTESNNPKDLSQKMEMLINEPKMGVNMCIESSKIKNFDVPIAKEKMLRIFEDLVVENEK